MILSGYNRTLAQLFHLGGVRPKDMKVSPSPRALRVIGKKYFQSERGLGEPTQVHLDWVRRVTWYKQFICIHKHHVTLFTQSGQTWVGLPSHWV